MSMLKILILVLDGNRCEFHIPIVEMLFTRLFASVYSDCALDFSAVVRSLLTTVLFFNHAQTVHRNLLFWHFLGSLPDMLKFFLP